MSKKPMTDNQPVEQIEAREQVVEKARNWWAAVNYPPNVTLLEKLADFHIFLRKQEEEQCK